MVDNNWLEEDDPHAVRWARRALKHMFTLDYTKWHWTEDSTVTLCGARIQIGCDGGTFLPETDELKSTVTCRHCVAALGRADERT